MVTALYAANPPASSMEPVIEEAKPKSAKVTAEAVVTNSVTNGNFTLKWVKTKSYVTLIIKGKTAGWVAFMIGAQQKMKNGDIYIGYVKDGKAYVADHFGADVVKHKADDTLGGKNSIIEYSGVEKDGFTQIAVKIDITQKDAKDNGFAPGEYNVILAAGPDDNFTTKHNQMKKVVIKIKE